MKPTVKLLADLVAAVLVLPAVAAYAAGSVLLGRQRAFAGWSQTVALVPGLSGVFLRRAFYTWVLPKCGRDVHIGFGTVFSHPTACLGDTVYVGAFCVLGDVTLEDDVLLGSNVSIINGSRQHGIERLDRPIREQPGEWPRITIGANSWIGDRSLIMADVGTQAVIGGGSVVTRPVPDRAVAAGVPARVIRMRGREPEAKVGGRPTESGDEGWMMVGGKGRNREQGA